jgi:hypothetical protein
MRRSTAMVAGVGVVLLLGACTGPVRSGNVYESKAGQTAEVVASAVQTALLAVEAAGGDKAFGRYLTQVLVEAEEDADSAQGTFDSIQPPDRRADELRSRLDGPLGEATDTLTELRIAARRGRFAELPELARPLPQVAEELGAFAEAHG